MKNKNEIFGNDKLFIKQIWSCKCKAKIGDVYYVTCKIHQRGEHEYLYRSDDDFIEKRYSGKKLWLRDDAKITVDVSIRLFESVVGTITRFSPPVDDFTVYYLQNYRGKYDIVVEYMDDDQNHHTEYYSNYTVSECIYAVILSLKLRKLQELLWRATENAICENPFYKAAQREKDKKFMKEVKLYYRIATPKECSWLAKKLGVKILPSLSEKFDEYYVVDADTISQKILRDSGYTIRHRPYFNMKDSTHSKWQLNPHTKIGIDAAKNDDESISFLEYLELIKENTN